MTAYTLTIPSDYGYVLGVAVLTAALQTWHGLRCGPFRKAAKVSHPGGLVPASEAAESNEKYLYNCAVRAHMNYLENQPSTVIMMLIAGLAYPVSSAGLGAAWCVARVMYAVGYTDGKPRGTGREVGTWFFAPQAVLLLMSAWASVKIVI